MEINLSKYLNKWKSFYIYNKILTHFSLYKNYKNSLILKNVYHNKLHTCPMIHLKNVSDIFDFTT